MIRRCVRTLRLQDEIVHQPFVLTKVKLHEIQLSATKLTQNLHIVVGRTYFVIKTYKHHCYLLREREMFILRTERERERGDISWLCYNLLYTIFIHVKNSPQLEAMLNLLWKKAKKELLLSLTLQNLLPFLLLIFTKNLQLLTISLVLPSFKYTGICLQSTVSRLIVQL